MSRDEFNTGLRRLFDFYGSPANVGNSWGDEFFRAVGELSAEQFDEAISLAIKTQASFPTPADLLRMPDPVAAN